MGKVKGSMNFGANFNIESEGPIDARTVVEKLADLTTASTWVENGKNLNPYKGMTVNVLEDGSLWMLTGATQTDIKSWKRLDGGGKGELVLSGSSTVSISNSGTSAKTTYVFSSPKLELVGDTYISGKTDNHKLTLSADVVTTSAALSAITATGQLADAKAINDLVNTSSSNTISALTTGSGGVRAFKNIIVNDKTISAITSGDTLTLSGSNTVTLAADITNKKITFTSPMLELVGDTYISGKTDNHKLTLSADVVTTSAAVATLTTTGQLIDAKAAKEYTDKKISDLSGSSESAITGITISSITPTEANVKEEFVLYDTVHKAERGPRIKIYKDSALQKVYLGHVDDKLTNDTAINVTSGTGDTALCFIYLLTNGKYSLTNIDVSQFYEDAKFNSGVTVDANHIVHGVVDANSGDKKYLYVGGNGFYISGVTSAISGQISTAISGLVYTDSASTAGTYVSKVDEKDGKIEVSHSHFSGLSISVPSAKTVVSAITFQSGSTTGFTAKTVYCGNTAPTINIPTKLSHLTDDIFSGKTAAAASKVNSAITFQPGSTTGFTAKTVYCGNTAPTIYIPTKLSDLKNDGLGSGTTFSGTGGNEATVQELVDYYKFEQSSTAVTSVSNIPTGSSVVIATVGSNGTLSLSSLPKGKHEYHILIKNSSSNKITISINTSYVSTTGSSFVIPGSSWGEANILVVNGTAYVRATA